jgi:hypothetical protein
MFLAIFRYHKQKVLTNYNKSYVYVMLFTYLNTGTLYNNNFRAQDNGSIDTRSLSNHMCHIFIVRKRLMLVYWDWNR